MIRTQHGERLLVVLFFTLILSVMNATMFNIALPELKQEFEISSSVVGWVMSGYIVVYAIGSVTFGKLADMFPLRRLLLFGLLFLAAGSMFGLFAQTFWMVMLGRILQAVGASVIPAAAMIIPVRYFPVERRGRAMGMVATGLATGTAIGPIVAGFVAGALDWRFLFLLPLLMLLTLPFYFKYLIDEEPREVRFDWQGGLLLGLTIVGVLLAITWSDWRALLLGLLSGAWLIRHTLKAEEPFITRSLFANRAYRIAILVAFATTGTIFVIPFTMPLLLADVHGLTVGQIGMVLFPGALVAALLGRQVGRWTDERGSKTVFGLSAGFMALAFSLLVLLSGTSPYVVIAILLLAGVGQVGLQISLSNQVSATLPKESVGLGMGMFSMLNFISGATATTLVSKLLDRAGTTGLPGIGWVNHYSTIFLVVAALMLLVLFVTWRLQK